MNEKNSLNNSNLIYDRVVTEWNELIKNISIAKKAHTDASYNNLCAFGYCPPSLITQKNIGGFHINVHEKKNFNFYYKFNSMWNTTTWWLVGVFVPLFNHFTNKISDMFGVLYGRSFSRKHAILSIHCWNSLSFSTFLWCKW